MINKGRPAGGDNKSQISVFLYLHHTGFTQSIHLNGADGCGWYSGYLGIEWKDYYTLMVNNESIDTK
jgi:hypothetical protein